MSKNEITVQEDKKIIKQLFWRSFALEGSFNFEKMQALGFAWAMFPVIKKYYNKKEDQIDALKRHTAFFNITPYISTFPMGLAASMEKEYSKNKDIDPSTINAIKVSLMGPLSGIGDSFFWGTFRVIAAGVGISLAQQGNVLGPILFLLIFNVPHFIIRYLCTVWGFNLGSKFIQSAYENGIINHMTKFATVIGLTTVGAMISSMVTFNVAYTTKIGSMEFVLQDVINQIMPNLLPLLLTIITFLAVRKGIKTNYIIIAIFALGLIATMVGIM